MRTVTLCFDGFSVSTFEYISIYNFDFSIFCYYFTVVINWILSTVEFTINNFSYLHKKYVFLDNLTTVSNQNI